MEIIFSYLAFGLIFAFIAASISEGKGRERMEGFILGLLFNLIGIIIVACMSDTEEAKMKKKDLKKCPSCAELVKKEAVKCRYCGEYLPLLESDNAAEVEDNTESNDGSFGLMG